MKFNENYYTNEAAVISHFIIRVLELKCKTRRVYNIMITYLFQKKCKWVHYVIFKKITTI